MLLFIKGHHLALIASGAKTTTIRPWKTCTLQPGHVLSFNGRIRVVLTHVEPRVLCELTDDDAHADGFESREAFQAAFRAHYPHVSPDARVFVLRFTLPAQ